MQIKSVLVACAIAAMATMGVATMIDSSNIDAEFASEAMLMRFSAFKTEFGRSYASPQHEANRLAIFTTNMNKAAELSKKVPSAKFGVNQFADIDALEFARTHLNFKPLVGDDALKRMNRPVRRNRGYTALPTNFDWRAPDQGRPVGVTAVKDQGQCGSCWAFSATESAESSFILAGNNPIILAPQQTVDCDTVDAGCNGGDTPTAYAYMEGAGIQTEASYPYTSGLTGSAGTCAYNASDVAVKISSFVYATPACSGACTSQNEDLLAQNLYKSGPVSICVDASPWQTYTSGILTDAAGCDATYTDLDHCVQLVGFGVDSSSNTKFWSVRNSWASSWGEAGYIRLLYGANTCGVADEATQVVI